MHKEIRCFGNAKPLEESTRTVRKAEFDSMHARSVTTLKIKWMLEKMCSGKSDWIELAVGCWQTFVMTVAMTTARHATKLLGVQ
jgi:hypothetical protein